MCVRVILYDEEHEQYAQTQKFSSHIIYNSQVAEAPKEIYWAAAVYKQQQQQ